MEHPAGLVVTTAEDGMKLLRFLECRLTDAPGASVLHKWIRTGQVRINKGRAKPFALVREGDVVRLPPFAQARGLAPPASPAASPAGAAPLSVAGLPLIANAAHYMVLAKPAGLPVQSGSGHTDSVAERLRGAYAGQAFIPAPAHRLDLHTSGLLLVGTSHKGLRDLHARFAAPGTIAKEYLAWVEGRWNEDRPCLLLDTLEKTRLDNGSENMRALPGGRAIPLPIPPSEAARTKEETARAAVLAVQYVHLTAAGFRKKTATLLLVRLFTGRTHQIRVQLASRGFPIMGDGRYGGPLFSPMLLHAYSLSLAPLEEPASKEEGREHPSYRLPPDWPEPFAPTPASLEQAGLTLKSSLPPGSPS